MKFAFFMLRRCHTLFKQMFFGYVFFSLTSFQPVRWLEPARAASLVTSRSLRTALRPSRRMRKVIIHNASAFVVALNFCGGRDVDEHLKAYSDETLSVDQCKDRDYPIFALHLMWMITEYSLCKRTYHCSAYLLLYQLGFTCFAYVELATDLLVWSNPSQSNRRSAIQW